MVWFSRSKDFDEVDWAEERLRKTEIVFDALVAWQEARTNDFEVIMKDGKIDPSMRAYIEHQKKFQDYPKIGMILKAVVYSYFVEFPSVPRSDSDCCQSQTMDFFKRVHAARPMLDTIVVDAFVDEEVNAFIDQFILDNDKTTAK